MEKYHGQKIFEDGESQIEINQANDIEHDSLYRNFSYADNADYLHSGVDASIEQIKENEIKFSELNSNTKYEKNGYEFLTNEKGKVCLAYGKLELGDGGRTVEQTRGGKLGLKTDEGGHLIGQRFTGPTDGFNLIPQDTNLNRGAWKAMENE